MSQITAQADRLPSGGAIDRSRTLSFTFDGARHCGHPGDTLASALLASGVRLVGRSFKYHRPRGIMAAGSEEANALVELRTGDRREPNTRATTAELYDGLAARSQNRWPSLDWDMMSAAQWVAPFLAAGFYYKTFMWPASFWEQLYERAIRRAAGLGRAAHAPDPDTYEKVSAHCDVLVVGGGSAGQMAALIAARSGARVILADEDFALAGQDGELASLPNVSVLPRTTVFGAYDGEYGAVERVSDHLAAPPPFTPRQRLWRVVARRCVLAAGAVERPVAFGANDLPGVMLAGAVSTYIRRYAVRPGCRAVLFANHNGAAQTALDLAEAGVAVAAIVDPRPATRAMIAAADRTGAALLNGSVVHDAAGRHSVRGVHAGPAGGRARYIACDLVAVSGGWNPTLHLSTHLGGKPVWRDDVAAFAPGPSLPPGMSVAGAANGTFTPGDALAEAARAGAEAAEACGFHATIPNSPADAGSAPYAISPIWRVKGRRKAFVDFQNDVTDTDVELSHREGFRAAEHMKRYTTLGMATDQGKTSGVGGIAIMAELTGRSIGATGTTTARPPYTPVSLGALAGMHRGEHFRPVRLPPSHDWAAACGAAFTDAGPWRRAAYFPQPGEDWLSAATREVRAVQDSAGFCDVSTLGKIDIQGPDAAAFLDRVYANTFSTLRPGRVRYGIMLREDGFVFDDGTTACLAPGRYVMTTTTSHAGSVLRHLELCRQWLFPGLDVQIALITEQWAQFSVAGPQSRDTIATLVDPPFDIGASAFPYMAAAELTVCGGIPARLFRLSFSGRLAYEVAVPTRYGASLAMRLSAAGAVPYGLEALNVMRVEKGHATGAELNGQTTAHDLGMARMLSTRKDFVGRAMAQRPALTDPARPRLVGLRATAPGLRIEAGAHLLPRDAPVTAAFDQGHVTSAAFSPELGAWIGLGLLARGPDRVGEIVRAADPLRGREAMLEVVAPCMVDPEGARLHG